MINQLKNRIVFFDLDGTLHQQDMFSSFMLYMIMHLPWNILLVIPFLPIVIFGFILCGSFARWPMSLLLWSITFGHRESKLQQLQLKFAADFNRQMRYFPAVLAHLTHYLSTQDTQVWIITGSPESLIKDVYRNAFFLSKVCIIGSHIRRCYGGWVLTMRCLGYEKVIQLERKIGKPLKLYSGYSDSIYDNPLLYFCKYRWRVNENGILKRLH